jgi:hypothetical protein
MLKRLLPAALTLALLAVPLQVAATDYRDIWYLLSTPATQNVQPISVGAGPQQLL